MDRPRGAELHGLDLGDRVARSKENVQKIPRWCEHSSSASPRRLRSQDTFLTQPRAHWFQPGCHCPCHAGKFQTPHEILKKPLPA